MAKHNQAEIEEQLKERWLKVAEGKLLPKDAFGNLEDWIIQLGERKAFLHPNRKEWMWYDRIHQEWVYAECGPGKGILIVKDSVSGMKKLPEPGLVGEWCVYSLDDKLFGPMKLEELPSKLDSIKNKGDVLIWSPRATKWFKLDDAEGRKLVPSEK